MLAMMTHGLASPAMVCLDRHIAMVCLAVHYFPLCDWIGMSAMGMLGLALLAMACADQHVCVGGAWTVTPFVVCLDWHIGNGVLGPASLAILCIWSGMFVMALLGLALLALVGLIGVFAMVVPGSALPAMVASAWAFCHGDAWIGIECHGVPRLKCMPQ